jgi:hypothetical protein
VEPSHRDCDEECVQVRSAGSTRATEINAAVLAAMQKAGIDSSAAELDSVESLDGQYAHYREIGTSGLLRAIHDPASPVSLPVM